MTDATVLRTLAFVHPIWMVISLLMAFATARLGLRIRKHRLAGQAVGRALRQSHLRLGKASLIALSIGFSLGPLSMFFFRDRAIFDSFHSILGIIVLSLFAWTGWTGRALAHGNREARDLHRVAAASSLGAALFTAVAGFILLP